MATEKIKYVISDTYKQALSSNESEKWKKAMTEEIQSMHENNTWKLVPRPADVKPLACKWIYRIKEGNSPNDPPRFKARLVAKGFHQREGIDFNEIFASVVKYKTLRLLIAMTAVYDWHIEKWM
ncbi:unnamed protein product [Rhodiola kirilowii]